MGLMSISSRVTKKDLSTLNTPMEINLPQNFLYQMKILIKLNFNSLRGNLIEFAVGVKKN